MFANEIKPAPNPLTKSENRVLMLMVQGYSFDEIAAKLCIGRASVLTYKSRILRKLKMQTLAQVTLWAIEQGLLPHLNQRQS